MERNLRVLGCTSPSRFVILEGAGSWRMACHLSSLTGADQAMEKTDDVAQRHAAEIRQGDRVLLDIGSFKANVYE
jgi:hypothetical protein